MATLKSRSMEVEIPDGSALQEAAEELGVPFGCRHGVCGTCVTGVAEGMENLAEPTEEETAFELQEGQRMLCQCRINSGTVLLDLD